MDLKIHDSDLPSVVIAFPADRKQLAEQLIARLIAKVKGNDKLDESRFENGGAIAAAIKLVDEARNSRPRGTKLKLREFEIGRDILGADAATQKESIFFALTHLAKNRHLDFVTDRVCEALLSSLLRKKLDYSHEETAKLLVSVASESFIHSNLPVASILTNVERQVEKNGLHKSVGQQLKRMTPQYNSGAMYNDARKIGQRVEALLKQPSPENPGQRKSATSMNSDLETKANPALDLNTGEAWTTALLESLNQLSDEARSQWNSLLEHCRTAKSSKPTKKFLKESQKHLGAITRQNFIDVTTPALSSIGQAGECQRFNYCGRIEYGEPTQIHDTHVDCLRGIVWTTSLIDDVELIGIVGDAAENCFQKIREFGPRSPKIGNACLIALSSLASEAAVAQLCRLQSRARHVSTRKQIAKAIQQAAANAGITEADLVELGVPKFGLTHVGEFSEEFGDVKAEVVIHANAKPQTVWRKAEDKTQKSVPKTIKETHSDQLKSFQKRLKDIEKLMPSIRHRIEKLFLTDRTWRLSDFRKRYLDHPLVGVIARRLIWNVEQEGIVKPLFWESENWTNASGDSIPVGDEARISIWHPLHVEADEVLQWRNWLQSHQIVQPFKQAHREVYILTDAERATVDHSCRFESHIIRQHQFSALCQQRGWRFDLQGDWDSWNQPYLDLPLYDLQATLGVDPMEGQNEITQSFVYAYLATEQVSFHRLQDGQTDLTNPVPLDEIPAVVFSEVMRDVDLFVGVTSIGNDPEWLERDAAADHQDYWEKYSFGELTSQTAITRKQTLTQILPSLEIAEQCRLDGRFLIVDGQLRTYKIHLGSGNVLMSPDDRYLCIVQCRGSGKKRTDNLYLPFEGDNTLSLILSKAFLLANDEKIKDATIRNQIRR